MGIKPHMETMWDLTDQMRARQVNLADEYRHLYRPLDPFCFLVPGWGPKMRLGCVVSKDDVEGFWYEEWLMQNNVRVREIQRVFVEDLEGLYQFLVSVNRDYKHK